MASVDSLASQLQRIYAQYPSLRTNANPEAIRTAAERVLGKSAAEAIAQVALSSKDVFLEARPRALDGILSAERNSPPPRKTAVVSGLSAGGMVAAAILARSGYKVEAFDLRDSYTRNIVFGARQSLVDQLGAIDPKLAERFLELASPLTRGIVVEKDGKEKVYQRPPPESADPTRVPRSGEQMLEPSSALLIECKIFEQLLFEYLEAQPNVTIHRKSVIELSGPDENGNYSVAYKPARRRGEPDATPPTPLGTPDLVVVSEGANSATRRALGITSAPTSPEARFIAGLVHENSGGRVKVRDVAQEAGDGAKEKLITVGLGPQGLGKATWVVTQVPKDVDFDPVSKLGLSLDPASPEYRAKQQELVERHYRQSAALVLDTTTEALEGTQMEGPFEGARPTMFTLQQRMSERATAGNNVLGLGDFVGNAHFTVGGGMMTAAVAHPERLKTLLLDLELGTDKATALEKYNQGAMEDTLAWGRRGIVEFYPEVKPKVASDAFLEAVEQWRSGAAQSPLEALEKILETGSKALEALGGPQQAA